MTSRQEHLILASSDEKNGASEVTTGHDAFTTVLKTPIIIPKDAKHVCVSVIAASIPWTSFNILAGVNDRLTFQRVGDVLATVVILDPGLYYLRDIAAKVRTELKNAGFDDGSCVISPDSSTQKIMFAMPIGMSITFTADSPFALLGCANNTRFPEQAGTFTTAAKTFYSPNASNFGSVSSFLIHSDLVSTGLQYSSYVGVLAEKVIDRLPNTYLSYEPLSPLRITANNLIGQQIDRIRFWLTTQNNTTIDLNSADWTVLIRIMVYRPLAR